MLLPDVNVVVNAYRDDAAGHPQYKTWLEDLINSEEAFGVPDLVFSGFIRIVTHPRVFSPFTPVGEAIEFAKMIRSQPNFRQVLPGVRHWDIFTDLCRATDARGNLVADAYLAALAIESGNEWVTDDGDYARFPGLRWRRPFS